MKGRDTTMSQSKKTLKAIPGTTLRRLRNTPSYFFLLWRWIMWIFALIWIEANPYSPDQLRLANTLLLITFLQSLVVTLYAPVFQIFFPWLPGLSRLRLPRQAKQRLREKQRRMVWGFRHPRTLAEDEEADILTPLARTRNQYWDIALYSLDVIICGLVTYYGGALGDQPFGNGSPFYRFGFSAAFAAAFAYRYRGAIAASLGYDLFILLGVLVPPPGAVHHVVTAIDLESSFIDVPIAAILAAYLATLLSNYTRTKREVQDNARTQQALVRVGETLIRGASDRQQLLQQSVVQMRQGGHFQRLVLALVEHDTEEPYKEQQTKQSQKLHLNTSIGTDVTDNILPEAHRDFFEQVLHTGTTLNLFEAERGSDGYGIARLYLPLLKDGRIQVILGAESRRQTPFGEKQEKFLTISGTQLLIVLENMRLAEQSAELAAVAERGRIAREIHDGVAQLVYMLSLHSETCATQARRIVEASDEEDVELLTPLADRLDKLVTISKQALWETRNYMFHLKPLMSGTSTLSQMLTNQLREFETISGLTTHLTVLDNTNGEQTTNTTNTTGNVQEQPLTQQDAQVGAAIFRIVQEALTNAYKHAEATRIDVSLHREPERITVEIADNGHGIPSSLYSYDLAQHGTHGTAQRLYSGHGLRGMRERAEELQGTFAISQIPGGGTKIRVSIPTR